MIEWLTSTMAISCLIAFNILGILAIVLLTGVVIGLIVMIPSWIVEALGDMKSQFNKHRR